jgi:hypothetical protein
MLGLFLLICFSGCKSSTFNELNTGEVLPLPNDEYGIIIQAPVGMRNTYLVLTSDGWKNVSVKDVEKFKSSDYDYIERHFDFDSGWIYTEGYRLSDEPTPPPDPPCSKNRKKVLTNTILGL